MLIYSEVPIDNVTPVPVQLFVNDTLESLSCSSSATVTGQASTVGFPRTYGIAIAGNAEYQQWLPPVPYSGQITGNKINSSGYFPTSTYNDTEPLAWCGRFDACLIGLNWEAADSGGTYDRAFLVDAIKQVRNGSNYPRTYVFQYEIIEGFSNTVQALNGALTVQMNASNWWLYAGPNTTGGLVQVSSNPYYETNFCISYPNGSYGVPADTQFNKNFTTAHYDGLNEDYPQFAAAYLSDVMFIRQTSVTTVVDGTIPASAYEDPRFHPLASGASNNDAMKAPNVDGLWSDNMFILPYWTGYYDLQTQEGSFSYTSEACPWLLRGYQHLHNRFLQIMALAYPGRTYLPGGNFSSWVQMVNTEGVAAFNTKCAGIANFLKQGMLEGLVGASWSLDTSAGTVACIQAYQAAMDVIVAPKILCIMGYITSATDFQGMRYILALCLTDDGYCCVNIGDDYRISQCIWPDEYGGNPGSNVPVWWFGQRNGSRPTAAAINGVWVYDFQHCTVLLNPKGNGSQSITNTQINNYLGTGYSFSHIVGTQNPSLNNGAAVTSLTLVAGDAGFLRH